MNFNTIIYEKKENYAIIYLNRPEKLNALNDELFTELDTALSAIELDENVRGLIITGHGEKAFAAGADIKELHANNSRSGKQFSEKGSSVFIKLEQMTIPVIAAINGFALGGGCELALACHIRIAADTARMGQPEVNLGIIPGYGGTQRLAKIVGKAKAMELILTGDMIDAATAEKIGLVNSIIAPEALMLTAQEMIEKIISKAPLAVAAAIESINASEQLTPLEGLAFESRKFGNLCDTDDFKEGTRAFLEKRKAEFKSR